MSSCKSPVVPSGTTGEKRNRKLLSFLHQLLFDFASLFFSAFVCFAFSLLGRDTSRHRKNPSECICDHVQANGEARRLFEPRERFLSHPINLFAISELYTRRLLCWRALLECKNKWRHKERSWTTARGEDSRRSRHQCSFASIVCLSLTKLDFRTRVIECGVARTLTPRRL